METTIRINFWLLLFYSVAIRNLVNGDFLEPGSCSSKCRQNNESISVNTSSKMFSSSCSCSPSCVFYKDCCFDSPFRSTSRRPSPRTICLSLHNKASYKAVARCSSDWKDTHDFCVDSIGHLPPVTSNKTGITYANIHCAICNDDIEKLILWDVQLRCCDEHHISEDDRERHYIYRNGYLQSVISRQSISAQKKCFCKFYAPEDNHSFTDSLELRICEPKVEISKCSSTWRNGTVRELCGSFLDPVYAGGNIYRNLYCAQCNYENSERVRCKPAIINQKIAEGSSMSNILKYCIENDLKDCVHFLNHMGKGGPYAFSSLMKINLRECVPVNGKCCSGQTYLPRFNICKKRG